MSTQTESVSPETRAEMDMAEICGHDGCLHNTVLTATVTVGDVEQEWCLDCVESEFGLNWRDYQKRQQSMFRFVTPATVGSFMTGLLLAFLIASVAVV
jgi:hypothetical protein